jgi:hypothetical protein
MSVRRLVREAIEIVSHDVQLSDETPQSGSDEELGLPELNINNEVQEINELFDTASNYQILMNEYPSSKVLTASEERFFNLAVEMSMAGTGLSAEDLKLAIKGDAGITVSQENLQKVIGSVAKAIVDIISLIIRKIKEFWIFLTSSEADKREKTEREVADTIAGIMDSHINDIQRGIEERSKLGPNSTGVAVKDLGGGVTLEGDSIVIKDARPGSSKGKEVRISLRHFMNIPWENLNRVFDDPPSDEKIDISKLPNELTKNLQELEGLQGIIKRTDSMLESISNSTKAIPQMSSEESIAREMEAIIKNYQSLGSAFKAALPPTHNGVRVFLPGSLGLECVEQESLAAGTAWATAAGSRNTIVVKYVAPAPKVSDRRYMLKFGAHPSQMAHDYNQFVTQYLATFKAITGATDGEHLGKVDAMYKSLSLNHQQASTSAAGQTASRSVSDMALRDLLAIGRDLSITLSSYYRLLQDTLRMVDQHRDLWNALNALGL